MSELDLQNYLRNIVDFSRETLFVKFYNMMAIIGFVLFAIQQFLVMSHSTVYIYDQHCNWGNIQISKIGTTQLQSSN